MSELPGAPTGPTALAVDATGAATDAVADTDPGGQAATVLRSADGHVIPLHTQHWSAPADECERAVLTDVAGPVLDIGCGPGRLVVALAERGVPALGVDASPVAVAQAHARCAPALVRSVFDPIPGAGRWRTALLFDGNVGIGGDPVRLLRRVATLLANDGRAVVETEAPGAATHRFAARVERGADRSAWFPWAQVGADHLDELASEAGLRCLEVRRHGGRWFGHLEPAGAR